MDIYKHVGDDVVETKKVTEQQNCPDKQLQLDDVTKKIVNQDPKKKKNTN